MLKVYHAPQSRSSRLIWLLEECQASYEIDYVTISRQDGSGGPDPRNPHPLKQVPAIEHEGVVITQSAVIFDYLCGVFSFAGMKPLDAKGRAQFASWIGLYESTLEPVINAKFRSADGFTPIQAAAYEALCSRWKGALETGPFLMGEKFSAIDILFGSLPMFFRTSVPDDKIYDEWIERLSSRPALTRARYKDAPPF
jgi:glutathione S-transferase